MKHFINTSLLLCLLLLAGCTTQQLNQTLGGLNDVLGTDAKPTTAEVGSGLKEALINGITRGSKQASQLDGYFKNPSIKIPFPEDVKRVEDKLRQIGLGKEVDKFVLTLNRGAEQAAKEAAPIFVTAIKSLTIQDAWAILKGEENAATNFLKRTTEAQLKEKFSPIMQTALNSVNATKYYSDVINTYNKIPLVQKANPDLNEYATQKAIDGLFLLVANEEKRIREDPIARTSDLLKKVFGQLDTD